MKLALALLIVSAALQAQNPEAPAPTSSKLLIASDVALISATVADVVSSRGLYERDPILGRGNFGAKQATLSIGLATATVLLEIPITRRWPKTKRIFAIVNFGEAGAHGFAATHNERLK
jgi:tetrahydromethanopterin S-methyltransferase subunit F